MSNEPELKSLGHLLSFEMLENEGARVQMWVHLTPQPMHFL